ncbi:hypothetical protein B0J18DRAFT_21739 [Chaetomium sp. MPI-SDFR-AT-0129]|nr:hypothetical protein B0J18DRAFT_21739 [Chaetomium sp. MPI-SDFR-AT-0129]
MATQQPDLNAVFCLWLKFQAPQKSQARRISEIAKLTDFQHFPGWHDRVIHVLRRLDLDKYILRDVPEPSEPTERAQWQTERADIDDYLQNMIPDYTLWMNLKGMGWDIHAQNPKRTFDLLIKYFCKRSDDDDNDENKLLMELWECAGEGYDETAQYITHLNYLRHRHAVMGYKIEERQYLGPFARASAETWGHPHEIGLPKLGDPRLTWEAIMQRLQQIAVDQRTISVTSAIDEEAYLRV